MSHAEGEADAPTAPVTTLSTVGRARHRAVSPTRRDEPSDTSDSAEGAGPGSTGGAGPGSTGEAGPGSTGGAGPGSTGGAGPGSTGEVGADPSGEPEEPPAPTLLEQMGGISGVVASGVPVVVFVAVQAVFSSLTVSLVAAVASALAIAVWRLVRGEPIQPALSGLFGVAVCAFIAHRTGQAKGFFLLGIWTSLLYGGVFLVSVLVRWPLVGVIWHLVNSQGQGWRSSPPLRRAFDLASLAWVVVFGARFVVQNWLYNSQDADDLLGWVRLAMGVPLAALAALVTLWAIRRSQREHAVETPV